MACDKPQSVEVTEINKQTNLTEVSENETLNMEENMSGVLVLKPMPEFKMEAYNAKTGHYVEVSSEQHSDKWRVICFYPADFTFVCPTEIAAMNASLKVIEDELGCEVLAISTDTKFSHKRFVETEPLLKGLQLTMAADTTGEVAQKFGVLIEGAGLALRGRFLVNPAGIVVAQEVQSPAVGRSVKEFIRQIRAHQAAEKTGDVYPAGWKPGKTVLPVSTDAEKMTGNVGSYITIEEIMAD